MINLKAEVNRFCEWADSTTHRSAEWETEYPNWESLWKASEETLAKIKISPEDIRLLLYVIARDNECERVKEMLSEYPKNGMALAFSARGYSDSEARWQIADFLGTQCNSKSEQFLRAYFADSNEYVRRRAMLAMVNVDRGSAEAMALFSLKSTEENARLAAIRTLAKLESKELEKALTQLESDSSELVKSAVLEIRRAV